MAMQAAEIERLIKAALPDASVEIRDLAGDGDHYAATVVSPAFRGKSRVQQHQLVYKALQGRMGGETADPQEGSDASLPDAAGRALPLKVGVEATD